MMARNPRIHSAQANIGIYRKIVSDSCNYHTL